MSWYDTSHFALLVKRSEVSEIQIGCRHSGSSNALLRIAFLFIQLCNLYSSLLLAIGFTALNRHVRQPAGVPLVQG